MSELNDFEAMREDGINLRAENRQLLLEIERLRARVEELEYELNPDPDAHLMGWEGDDE